MSNWLKRTGLAVLCVLLAGQAAMTSTAYAVSFIGPDPRDYSGGGSVWAEVSRTGQANNLNAPTTFVSLYFKQPDNNVVRMRHFDQCRYPFGIGTPANPIDTDRAPANYPVGAPPTNVVNQGNTVFTFTSGGSIIVSDRNTVFDNNAAYCENVVISYTLSGLSRSTRPGLEDYYEVRLDASIINDPIATGSLNAFKVEVDPGPGCNLDTNPQACNYVSWSPLSGNRFALQQRGIGGTEYTAFNLAFAPSCDIAVRTATPLNWYDDDQAQGNQTRPIWFQVLRKPKGAPASQFVPLGPADLVGANAQGRYYPPAPGNLVDRSTTLYVEPNYDYVWQWNDVQTQNGVQFQIPYESIYYQIPCNNFNLLPRVTEGPSTAFRGEQISFGYQVENEGPNPSSPVSWVLRRRTIPAATPPLPQQDSDRAGQPQFGASGTGVTYQPGRISSPQGVVGGTYQQPLTVDAQPGEKICTSIGVNPAGRGVAWRYSAERCVLVVTKPTVHFMGGDVSVGNPYQSASPGCGLRSGTGSIYTVATDTDNGSVVEYGAFVRGMIQFQQAAGYGFGTASRPATNAAFMQRLGFANTTINQVGNSGGSECMTDYYDKYSAQIAAQASPGTTTLANSREVHYNGNVTINASNIQPGARILMVISGDVTINGDIAYANTYGNPDTIPSIAIIAEGDIRIRDSVRRLDGVYSSKGVFNTCYNSPVELTTNICNQQLNVNGVLMTDRLQLRRTYGGAAPNTSQPAERFNYTSELFFNSVLSDQLGNRVRTIEQRDLPPRY